MPFGEPLMELSNREYDNPYKFNGKELDSQTGLYYYGARYYDPQRSFWLSVDPLVEITMSPYAYTWNDPVNYADPSGMLGERIGDPGGPNIHKIYGPKGGTLIEGVVITVIKPIPDRRNMLSGIMSGMQTTLKDAVTFKGIRDMIGTGINSVRSLVDPSVKNSDVWQPQTLCITGDCSKFDPIEEAGPGMDMAFDTFNSLRNGDYHHAGENIGTGIVMLGMLFFPEGEAGEAGAVRTGNGFKALSRRQMASVSGANLVEIGTIEDDVMIFSSKIGTETVEGVTNFSVKDGKLHLNQLHLQGSSAGMVGRQALWNIAKDLGKQFNVEEVVIQGGKRTTGKYKGQVPSPRIIKVD
ncbi:hypothetical protein GCM10022217_25170 [Chryseobacterium ginsenosidimutans]|uniref:RHS repeat-associated core domain-containing protein n=1 Tax=Chryseobacterium ginsenosidimutans TaxID=687846 RepID=UPI0031E1BF2D